MVVQYNADIQVFPSENGNIFSVQLLVIENIKILMLAGTDC